MEAYGFSLSLTLPWVSGLMTQAVKSLGGNTLQLLVQDGHVTLKTRPDTVPPHSVVYEQQTERVCLPFRSLVCSSYAGAVSGLHSQYAERYWDDTNEQSEMQPREEESRYDDWIHAPGLSHDLSPGIPADEALFLHLYSEQLNMVGKELWRPVRTEWGSCMSWWRWTDRLWKPRFLGKGFSVWRDEL